VQSWIASLRSQWGLGRRIRGHPPITNSVIARSKATKQSSFVAPAGLPRCARNHGGVGAFVVIRFNALRHSEEQCDEAIQTCRSKLDCFAALAMTAGSADSRSSSYNELRHCEEQGDEAIQLCGGSWIASLRSQWRLKCALSWSSLITNSVIARSNATKQSSFVVQKLDCFAALAMTA